ncbi:CBS domain-containing protein [Mesorhizobium sp. SEMIA 3007]|uniref:CBS domain-containing protein n=1 Tax=Mesorhizobium sp. SEMIA 3007 TaxID=1862350 RepID=UPI0009F65C93|nr:CBS domain-containing protein [Mesorhizobium sp. SEMIA 3007]
MRASDIMTMGATTVRPDTTIEHAARVMLEHRISGLPVVNAQGKLLGIVTERDLLRREEIGKAARHRYRTRPVASGGDRNRAPSPAMAGDLAE